MDAQAISTRDRIIQRLMELFQRKGYGSTSIADILDTAEAMAASPSCSRASQELLVAVLEAYRDGIGPMLLRNGWGRSTNPSRKIFALLGTYRQLVDTADALRLPDPAALAPGRTRPDPEVRG